MTTRIDRIAGAKPMRRSRIGLAQYVRAGIALALFGVLLGCLISAGSDAAVSPRRLIAPIAALAGLTGAVWLSMVFVRNFAILRGVTRAEHYLDYRSNAPADWVERPARAFNNLFQVPVLFYVVSLLMVTTQRVDQVQLNLAWIFVALRTIHAFVYIGWNHLTTRFTFWLMSCIALIALWVRFLTHY
jgi:hypothetical protein